MLLTNRVASVAGVLLITAIAVGGASFFFQKKVDEDSARPVTAKKDDVTDSHANELLREEIDRIESQIARLKKDSEDRTEGAIEQRFSRIYEEIRLLREQINTLSVNRPSDQSMYGAVEVQPPEAALTEEEREQQLRAEVERQLALYEATALQEGSDGSWAPSAKVEVFEAFRALADEGISASHVECHTSFCQVQFSLANGSNESIGKLQEASPWSGETFLWIEDIEQGAGVVYFARDGYDLPSSNDNPPAQSAR
jgi:tRNA A37 N6-isopentenylltransferase MiaA